MTDTIRIEVEGLDKILDAFDRFPRQIAKNFSEAGHDAAKLILRQEGLQNYPPHTSANRPPTPYYVRGRGTQYKSYNRGESENLGKRWTTYRLGGSMYIANNASYARWVHGEEQARAMGRIGWRKLKEVGKEKLKDITAIYQRWINYTIKQLGL